jgi:allantoate deiminase
MRDCHHEIRGWLNAAGAVVSVDGAGNIRGLYQTAQSASPRLMIGSHLDTVPNAGAFDGVLGVLIGIELIDMLGGQTIPFAIEVIGFSEEEGVRFGTPFIGSRALIGSLDDELLALRDQTGISVRQAIENFGLNSEEIPRALLNANTFAYLEFHIEQGPVLESLHLPLAVVEAIAGQTRMEFSFLGRANHAGTTPMHLRHDALAAAAEWIVEVELIAKNTPEVVATVGRIEAMPGAANVIAGEVRAILDLRHKSDSVRESSVDTMTRRAEQIAEKRGLSLQSHALLNQRAVAMDSDLIVQIEDASRHTGCVPHRMVSGAGHDAMIVAEKIPSAMIFLRSPGGISHDPAETVEVDDVAKAIECGSYLIQQFARSPQFQERMSRA